MLGTVALDQWSCLFKLLLASVHVCSTFSRPAVQASLPQGHQTYSPFRMFDYMALDQRKCLKPSSYVCNRFTRLAGISLYSCFKRCFEPTGMFVAVASDHLARRLQLNSTSMHVCYSFILSGSMYITLHPTISHVWNNRIEPFPMYLTVASNQQSYL